MKTKRTVLSLFLLLTVFLAACNPQIAVMEAKPKDAMASDAEAAEAMKEKGEEMAVAKEDTMTEKDDAMMEDEEGVMEDDDDAMMEEDDAMMNDDDDMMDDEHDDMMDDEDGVMDDDDDGMMEEKDEGMMDEEDDGMMTPDWFEASLTEARSGETFTISVFKGKVVLVETLAMWCSNCLKQQEQVKALHDLLGERDDFVSLGIDIDPNENLDALKTYIENNGFDWNYTVAPAEVAREIGQLYGDQFLNPPSTPMLIIDRHGEVHPLPFGIKSAEELLEALEPFLSESM